MKAYLVTFSPMTRVVASSEEEAIRKAVRKIVSQAGSYIGNENLEDIKEDTEIPYTPGEVI
jgi:hypothetical protein